MTTGSVTNYVIMGTALQVIISYNMEERSEYHSTELANNHSFDQWNVVMG